MVVVKVLDDASNEDVATESRFLKKLDHPNVVKNQ